MGGRAGGGSSGGMGSRSGIGVTERGMSKAMASGVVAAEKAISGNNYETLHAFDANGNVIYTAKGKADSVRYDGIKTVDAVVTHNHPNGSAFSGADLKNAVALNQKEIRATGKEYTFSMKRPAKGWGTTPRAVTRYNNQLAKQQNADFRKYSTNDAKFNRKLWIKLSMEKSRKMAQHFGWEFSAKINK